MIYKFTCACCNACYIGETGRHFFTLALEHLYLDKSSHIFKNFISSERCCQSCSADYFETLDFAPTKFQLKLKEAMHINWEKPNSNQQVYHVNPDTYALGSKFFQKLCKSLKYVIFVT